MSRLIEAGGGLFNLLTRIVYVPFAVVSWTFLILQSWRSIIGLFAVGLVFYGVSNYGGTLVSTVVNTMQFEITPIYRDQVRPILAGIIQTFFNPLTCWYNGFIIFPYSVGRNGIFPILRDGGLLSTARAAAMLFTQFSRDFFLNYFANGQFLSQEFDYSGVFAKWQIFMNNWQSLWCYGCNDLCPIYTMTPNPIVSNQLKDPNWGDFLGKGFNGWMVALQQVIYVVRQVLFPTQPTVPYLNFDRSFQLWCESAKGLRISFENIMQEFWDAFIPYPFVWRDFLCFFDATTCFILQSINFVANLIIHANSVLTHFKNTDSTYWNNNVKFEFTALLNMIGPADYFDTIVMDQTNITNYQLLTRNQGAPNGLPNPIYNTTTIGQCFCIALDRLLCDPQYNGTTCAQQYNGTLVAGIDPCCLTNSAANLISNSMAFTFEFTLHFMTVSDFIQFTDKQPFTTAIKFGITNTVNCIWTIFRVVSIYGFCIERIFAELTNFIVCTGELVFRITVALLTTPYWNTFLPGQCNFITCPNSAPLTMELEYLNRISNASLPDGLVNCFCFTLNTGFNVPFAGCENLTCEPTGFIPPTNVSKKFSERDFGFHTNSRYREIYQKSLYEQISQTRENAHIIKSFYGEKLEFTTDSSKYRAAFKDSFHLLNEQLDQFSRKLGRCGTSQGSSSGRCTRTLTSLNITNPDINCTDPNNPIPNPVPCFGLCCLPVKLIQLAAHTVAFAARAINGAFQTRFGQSSDYWSGRACLQNMPCLKSDLTTFVIDAIAPVECLCQFLKLILPPEGFGDICCGFTRLAELISCLLQILINVANCVAGDAPNFTYIKGNQTTMDPPQLITDFGVVLDIALGLFDCICGFVRTIFAVAFGGTQIFRAFDPCCVPRVILRVGLEVARLLIRLIVVLSTLDSMESQCYIYVNDIYDSRPGCKFAVSELGIVIEFREIARILFAPPTFDPTMECAQTLNITSLQQQNEQGVTTCLCNSANALLAMVSQVLVNGTGDLNVTPKCTVNICCPIYSGGTVLFHISNVLAEFTATLWQNWRKIYIPVINNNVFVPRETLDYFFCDEYGPQPMYTYIGDFGMNVSIANPAIYPGYGPDNVVSLVNNKPMTPYMANQNGTIGIINTALKCGKLEPAIQSINNLLGQCLCTFSGNGVVNVLDNLLTYIVSFTSSNSQIFPFTAVWPGCFCSGGPNQRGIVRPAANAIVVAIRQIVLLARNIGNPTMWAPYGGTMLDPNYSVQQLIDNYADIRLTWINRFVAPFADAMCELVTNAGCVLSIILGNSCLTPRYTLLGSITRYTFEFIIKALSSLEGAVKLFTQEPPGLCVGNAKDPNGQSQNGNNNRPNDQGTMGDANAPLIPTCSPDNNLNIGSLTGDTGVGGVDTGKLGRLLSGFFNFIADALIGVARFGCSSLCPGFNETYFTEQIDAYPTTVSIPFSACDCWNDSPYTGFGVRGGEVCSFGFVINYAQPYVGSPIILDRGGLCGGAQSECSLGIALQTIGLTPESIPGLVEESEVIPCAPFFDNKWDFCLVMTGLPCNMKCYSVTRCGKLVSNDRNVVQPNFTITIPDQPASWRTIFPEYPFKPIVDLEQPNRFLCKVQNIFGGPTPQNIIDELKRIFGENVAQTIPYTGPPVTANDCYNTQPMSGMNLPSQRNLFLDGNAPWRELCFLNSLCGSSLVYNYLAGGLGNLYPANIGCQPNTLKSFLNTQGDCGTNCLKSILPKINPVGAAAGCIACLGVARTNRIYNGTYTADYQPPCTKVNCIITAGLCKNDQMIPCSLGGNPLDGIIISAIKYVSCLLKVLFQSSSINAVSSFASEVVEWIGNLLSWIWQLSGGIVRLIVYVLVWIISQLIALGQAWKTGNLIPFILGDLAINTIKAVFNVLGAFAGIFAQPAVFSMKRSTDSCIDSMCICDMFKQINCDNKTLSELFVELTLIFNTKTSCDSLIRHFSEANVTNWGDISYSERFLLNECFIKKNSIFNFDFPQPAKSFTDETIRKPIVDNFKKKFYMTRDHYARYINSRSVKLKEFYQKEYGMKDDSPTLRPLMYLELFHFKYSSGYYHYIYDNFDWSNYENALGTPDQNWNNIVYEFNELKGVKTVFRSVKYIKERAAEYIPTITFNFDFSKLIGNFPDLYIPTVRYNPPRFENITILPTNYRYNSNIEKNGDIAKRMLYSISHYFFPEYTTKAHHERFIVGGNCRIVDAVINEGTRISDYCLNEFKENIPGAKEVLGKRIGNSEHFQKYKGRITYVGDSWKRAKIDYIPLEKRVEPLHRDTYARAHGHRNLIFNIINSIGSFDFQQWITNFINDVIYWFKNPNLSDYYYPNVGFRYWVQFSIICKFPENLDCSIGIGLGNAIWEVGKYYLPIFIGLSLLFPGFSSILGIFFNFLIYFFIVLAVGWHYSPACIALFPTSNLGGTAWTIPVLPIPLNIFPALPMCLWDELLGVLDSVFTSCYTWIPQSWMNNQQCVGPVDIPNCVDVGIATPLESIVYWGYRIFGSIWCDIMVGITSVFGFLGNASVTCNAIKTASNTQMDRQFACGIASAGTIGWVILGGFIIGTFIVTVVLALLNVLHALLLLLPYVPFYNNAIGVFNRTENVNGELVVDEKDKVQIISKKQPGMVDYIAKGIKKTFLRYKKGDKME